LGRKLGRMLTIEGAPRWCAWVEKNRWWGLGPKVARAAAGVGEQRGWSSGARGCSGGAGWGPERAVIREAAAASGSSQQWSSTVLCAWSRGARLVGTGLLRDEAQAVMRAAAPAHKLAAWAEAKYARQVQQRANASESSGQRQDNDEGGSSSAQARSLGSSKICMPGAAASKRQREQRAAEDKQQHKPWSSRGCSAWP
jgi:hypothetical protein